MSGVRLPRLWLPVFGAGACAMVWFASSHGMGLLPDSMTYLEVARSLIRERVLVVDGVPLTHFPPLYPMLLAAAGSVWDNLPTAARLVHCALFALTVMAVGWAVWEGSGKSTIAATMAMWCTLVSAGIVQINVFALSEPLFLVLMITASLAVDRALTTGNLRWLLIAGSLTAAAGLTRYVGICLVLSLTAALVVFDHRPWSSRFRSAVIFGAVSCAPLAAWMVRNSLVQGTVVDRSLAFHPPGFEALRMLSYTLSFWVWPTPNLAAAVRAGMAVAMAVVLGATAWAAIVLWTRRRTDTTGSSRVGGVLLAFAVTYAPFLLASLTLVDAHTKLDNRILSPILIIGIVLAFARPPHPQASNPSRMRRLVPAAAWAAISLANLPWTGHILTEGRSTGFGYASAEWRNSELLDLVDALDPDVVVYSNAPEVLRVLRDRHATMIPRAYSPSSGRPNAGFAVQIDEMMARLESETAVLAYFDQMRSRAYLPTSEELAESHGLTVLLQAADGAVFTRRKDPAARPAPEIPAPEPKPADG